MTDTRNLVAPLTEAVPARFEGSRSPPSRQVMQSLVPHLHASVSEVQPTARNAVVGLGDQLLATFDHHGPGTAPDNP